MNNRRIILCLDIDQTIMNSHASLDLTDINGSNNYNDASAWINFLTEIKMYCEARSFQFFVQIITAKNIADIMVQRVFNHLHPFLLPLNKQGEVKPTKVILKFIPTEGFVSEKNAPFYYMQHENMTKRLSSKNDTFIDDDLLPPIHLCRYNLVSKKLCPSKSFVQDWSKALVMKHIAEYFLEITPAENMFLLDDHMRNINDVQKPYYGYQGVSAEALRQLEHGTKAARTTACKKILAELGKTIQARVDFILDNEPLQIAQDSSHPSSDQHEKSTSFLQVLNKQPHEIHRATKTGNLKRVQELIEENPDSVHELDAFNQNALLWAAFKGNHKMLALLISHGAAINQATQLPMDGLNQKGHDNTPLDWAIIGNHLTTIELLFQEGAISNHYHDSDILYKMIEAQNIPHIQTLIARNKSLSNQLDKDGYTPLHYAACFKEIELARYLIAAGADINIHTSEAINQYKNIEYPNQAAINIACSVNDVQMVALLFEKGAIITPTLNNTQQVIHLFASNGLLNHVKTLIERHPEQINVKNSNNETPLALAASKGHQDIVKFLISKGADINVATTQGYYQKNDLSALDMAIIGGHVDTIFILNNMGAIANHKHDMVNDKRLSQLIKDEDLVSIRILIRHNHELINQWDRYGFTPLHYAALYGHVKIIHYLMTFGANIYITTSYAARGTDNRRYPSMTAIDLWSLNHPMEKNPFNQYYRMHDLKKRQTEIDTLITDQMKWMIHYSQEKAKLTDLKQKVLQATFKLTDSPDKTADDVLYDITTEWHRKNSLSKITNKKHSFFSPNNTQTPTEKVFQAIKTLLCPPSNHPEQHQRNTQALEPTKFTMG